MSKPTIADVHALVVTLKDTVDIHSVRLDALGARIGDVDARVDGVHALVVTVKEACEIQSGRIDRLENRVGNLDERMRRSFDAMDQRFDAVDQRFDAMDQRFDAMDRRFGELVAGVAALRDEVRGSRRRRGPKRER